MKLFEDLDVYAFRRGFPKTFTPLMIFIYWETWPIVLYRVRNLIYKRVKIPIIRQILYLIGYMINWIIRFLTTISISEKATIGKGLYIPHLGNITISHHSIIGDYCVIHQGVTLGGAGRGDNYGGPTLGDNCFIGANACVVGKIKIGNNVVIGANAFIAKDIEDNAVMAAPLAIKISDKGSLGTVHYRNNNEKL